MLFVPFLPALGIFVNWFLMAHIGWIGLTMLVGYVVVGVILYGAISSRKNRITETKGNERDTILNNRSVSDLQQALLEGGDMDAL